MRNFASSATSAGAVSDGCTMKLGPPPKIAWNWFSPVTEKQVLPPFLKHGNPLRKYQHHGRWQTLPGQRPDVADLRRRHASGRFGQHRVVAPDQRMMAQRVERDQAADRHAAARAGVT